MDRIPLSDETVLVDDDLDFDYGNESDSDYEELDFDGSEVREYEPDIPYDDTPMWDEGDDDEIEDDDYLSL